MLKNTYIDVNVLYTFGVLKFPTSWIERGTQRLEINEQRHRPPNHIASGDT